MVAARAPGRRPRTGSSTSPLGLAAWVALFEVGRRPGRRRARDGPADVRLPGGARRPRARDRPLPPLPRAADAGARPLGAHRRSRSAISPNERLQQLFHPWTSYVIVPLFALANAGIVINGGFLAQRLHLADHARDPRRLRARQAGRHRRRRRGCVTRLSRGRLRPPVGWAAVVGGGTIAGIGFTVSLLIATPRLPRAQLEEAKLGVLSAALCASLLDLARLPRDRAAAGAGCGSARCSAPPRRSSICRAGRPGARPHPRPGEAPVTLVEYGDFECPYCGQAEPVIRELLAGSGDLRYVWRHLPLNDVHPHAQLAAEAAEAAADAGRVLGDARPAARRHQDELRVQRPDRLRRRARPRRRAVHATTCASTPARRASPRTSTPPT